MNDNLIDTALGGGGIFGILFAVLSLLTFLFLYISKIKNKNYKAAFNIIIIFLPVTFYSTRLFGISAYSTTPGIDAPYTQLIGLTTFTIFVQYFVMKINGAIVKQKSKIYKSLEKLIWLFSITLTITQFFSHTIFSACLLSIGAAWQYLLIFYIISSVIENEEDFLKFIKSIFIFSIFNKIFLMIVKGVPLIKSLTAEYTELSLREGNVGALGPPVSAAGYLAIFFTFGLAVYYYTLEKKYLVYIFFIFLEILNTFTRGGIFILFLAFIPFLFLDGKKIYKKIILLLVLSIPFWGYFWEYISFRGFNLDVTKEDNFVARFVISYLYFTEYYYFSFVGNGLLKPTLIPYTEWLSFKLHNVYLEILDVSGVIIFFIIIILTGVVFKYLYRYSKQLTNAHFNKSIVKVFAPFLFTAFLQWVVYANTTSTSILYFYPYEGTLFFWLLCFSPVIIFKLLQNKLSINSIQVNTHV